MVREPPFQLIGDIVCEKGPIVHGICSTCRSREKHSRLVVSQRSPHVPRRQSYRRLRQVFASTTSCKGAAVETTYLALRATITRGSHSISRPPTRVAAALKDWALEHGATHYTHWFQPMTGITAEKHDSFLSADQRRRGDRRVPRQGADQGRAGCVELSVGRHASTFEARGYTAWDPTSPPWLLFNGNSATLVIPTAFVSWTGEALDKKTPLLRSMEAVSKQAVRVLKLFGSTAERVFAMRSRAGVLPDRQQLLFRAARSDQRRPHALRRQAAEGPGNGGSVFRLHPARVLACMAEAELELFKLAVPVKTRHKGRAEPA